MTSDGQNSATLLRSDGPIVRNWSRHSLFPLAFRSAQPARASRLEIAWASLHQQVLQGTPVLHRPLYIGHQIFGNVKPQTVSHRATIQNPVRIRLAGETSRVVRIPAPSSSVTQRMENRWQQARCLAAHSANHIGIGIIRCPNHRSYVPRHTPF
jgi:hypothetical protein